MYDVKYMHSARINLLEIENNLDAKDVRLTDKILHAIDERIQSYDILQSSWQQHG